MFKIVILIFLCFALLLLLYILVIKIAAMPQERSLRLSKDCENIVCHIIDKRSCKLIKSMGNRNLPNEKELTDMQKLINAQIEHYGLTVTKLRIQKTGFVGEWCNSYNGLFPLVYPLIIFGPELGQLLFLFIHLCIMKPYFEIINPSPHYDVIIKSLEKPKKPLLLTNA
jgi:hypothetical protein